MPLLSVPAAILFAMLIAGGCASSGGASGGNAPRMGAQGALKCPSGYTATCEVRRIGRIHHGTFGKNNDSCACESNSSHAQTTPVIPRL